jgi:hypothetical protein
MAVTRTLLNNGPSKFLLHVYLESEGYEGELDRFVLADPTVYDKIFTDRILQPTMKLTLMQVWYSFNWFDGLISFDDTNPVPCWLLPRDAANYADFRYFGGLSHRLPDPQTSQGANQNLVGTDRTGKILLSTSGYAPLGSVGTIVLEVKKSSDY